MGTELMTLYERKEKLDGMYSGRAPRSLLERIDEIAKSEGASVNSIRARLLMLGAQAYVWMSQNPDMVEEVRREFGGLPHDLLPRILDLAKKSPKKR